MVGLVAVDQIWGRFSRSVVDVSLSFVSEVSFFMMIPLTQPASEFHRTWSPILNVFGIGNLIVAQLVRASLLAHKERPARMSGGCFFGKLSLIP
jgi:hypothetical protein